MATTLYLRADNVSMQNYFFNDSFSTKTSARAVQPGSATNGTFSAAGGDINPLITTIGTGTGNTSTTLFTVGSDASGVLLPSSTSGRHWMWVTYPIDGTYTISGTVTFNICGSEAAMTANAGWKIALYKLDTDGALTAIVNSAVGVEMSTSLARQTWTASPSSTGVSKGDRLVLFAMIANAGGNMNSGSGIVLGYNGSNASTTDSNIQLTETVGFLTSAPAATTYYLRDTASDLTPGTVAKALSTSSGASAATATYTTVAGTVAFPGNQFTSTAGGTAIEWYTPTLNAFTLGGIVETLLFAGGGLSFDTGPSSPFTASTVELAIVNSDGTNAVVWARNAPLRGNDVVTVNRALAGPDTSVNQGQRLRLRVYLGDAWPDTESAGSNLSIAYNGTGTALSRLQFSQTITEGSPPVASDIAWPFITSGFFGG